MNPQDQMPDLSRESAPQPETADSLGGLLHANRLRKNLSLDDVANITKYSKRQLQALEDKNWEILPQGFSLRALVRKYAEALGIDPELALEMLARETGNKPATGKATKSNLVSSLDYRMSPTPTREPNSGGFSIFTIIFLLFLVIVIALGVALWQGAITFDDLNLGFVKDWFEAV